jgi:hypothetical protein
LAPRRNDFKDNPPDIHAAVGRQEHHKFAGRGKELILGLGNALVATRDAEQPVEYMGTGFTGGKVNHSVMKITGAVTSESLQMDAEDMAHSRTLSGQRAEIASLCSVLEVLLSDLIFC